MLLLNQPPDEELLREIATYPRLIVICPRPDEVPNPLPGLYVHALRSGYVRDIGWVHMFVRRGS